MLQRFKLFAALLLLAAGLSAGTSDTLAEKDILQIVFTPDWRQIELNDLSLAKIPLAEFAQYLKQTLELKPPEGAEDIFDELDILYLYGFLGGTAEGVTNIDRGYFSVGYLAEILARIDGYANALDAAADPQQKAVEILLATGYYAKTDFAPLREDVTLANAQSLFMRTAWARKRLAAEFADYPLVWLDTAYLKQHRLTLRFHNPGRFERYSWTYGQQNVSGNVTGADNIVIALNGQEAGQVFIEVTDRIGGVWQFNAAVAAIPKVSRPENKENKKIPQPRIETKKPVNTLKFLTKALPPQVRPGEPLYIYAGLRGGGEVREIRIVFPDGAYVAAEPYGQELWRTPLISAIAGQNDYAAQALFADGTSILTAGSFLVGEQKTAQPKTPDTKQRLNKVYYPVEIMLSPTKPKPQEVLTIKARYGAPLSKVYTQINGQKIQLYKNGAIWQTQYILPAQHQTLYIQIYGEDEQGNLSMTEKVWKY
jgi:hypothetical protein